MDSSPATHSIGPSGSYLPAGRAANLLQTFRAPPMTPACATDAEGHLRTVERQERGIPRASRWADPSSHVKVHSSPWISPMHADASPGVVCSMPSTVMVTKCMIGLPPPFVALVSLTRAAGGKRMLLAWHRCERAAWRRRRPAGGV